MVGDRTGPSLVERRAGCERCHGGVEVGPNAWKCPDRTQGVQGAQTSAVRSGTGWRRGQMLGDQDRQVEVGDNLEF